MIVKYNSLNKFDKPAMTLCQPGSRNSNGSLGYVIGFLTDTEAEEIVFNFNSPSELNFRIRYIPREDPDENEYIRDVFNKVQNRRLIYVEDIGYFSIVEIKDAFEGKLRYKDVSAKSIDVELDQWAIPFVEDNTYNFLKQTADDPDGILDIVMSAIPLWTVGEIDDAVLERHRTFQDVDTGLSCLEFLINNVQDAFECLFIFDIKDRVINVYDRNSYVIPTGIHLTNNDVVNSINITENADNLYTALNVYGEDGITISGVNPTGSSTIYDFSYYYDWMPTSLRNYISSWQDRVDEVSEEFHELAVDYYEQLEVVRNLEKEYETYKKLAKIFSSYLNTVQYTRDTSAIAEYNSLIWYNGGTEDDLIPYTEDADELIEFVSERKAVRTADRDEAEEDLADANYDLNLINSDMNRIRQQVGIEFVFTPTILPLLSPYIFAGDYNDEYAVITDKMDSIEQLEQLNQLYDRARQKLADVSRPSYEFDVDTEGFIFSERFSDFTDQLETGCKITAELDDGEVIELYLSSITVNYDEMSMGMTFCNKYKRVDPKTLFNDALGDINKSANSIKFVKKTIQPIKSGELSDVVKRLEDVEVISGLRDATPTPNE